VKRKKEAVEKEEREKREKERRDKRDDDASNKDDQDGDPSSPTSHKGRSDSTGSSRRDKRRSRSRFASRLHRIAPLSNKTYDIKSNVFANRNLHASACRRSLNILYRFMQARLYVATPGYS